ncbi:MAG: O-antigen ligase family protein [Planctomycetota bacterium]
MMFLAVLFTLGMMLWLVPLARRGRTLWLALAVLGLGTVFGPNFFSIEGPIQISADRLLFAATLCIIVFGLIRGTSHPTPRLHRLDWIVVIMVLWFGWSAFRGGSEPPGTPPMARWLFYIAMPGGMYLIARVSRFERTDMRPLLVAATGLGLYLAITAVLEIKGLHGFVFPRYITNAEVWEFLGRGRGPLMNPSGNGFVIAIGLTAASIGWVRLPRRKRIPASIILLILLAGLYATLTRSAWLGGAAAVAIVAMFHSPRWLRVIGLACCVLLVGLATTSLKDEILRLKRDKNLSAADAEKSVKLRPLLAIIAWEMFLDEPMVGHGYGHYLAKHRPYHQVRGYDMPLEQARPYAQHNVFLSVLVDTGLIGGSMFLAWFLSTAAIAIKLSMDRRSDADRRAVGLLMLGSMLAYFCNGMFQDVMIIPMVHMFIFFQSGLTVRVAVEGWSSSHTPHSRPVERRAAGLAPSQS